MTPVEILTFIGALGTAAGVVYATYQKIIKPSVRNFSKVICAIDTIDKIKEEFKPNGGTSLRDAVNRIEIGLLMEQSARRATTTLMDIGVWETDASGAVVWGNKKYLEMIGMSLQEALGQGWINGIHFSNKEKYQSEWIDAITQKRIFSCRTRYVSKNPFEPDAMAHITRVSVYAVPVISVTGKLLGYVGISTPYDGVI